jgi:hypothetical protein
MSQLLLQVIIIVVAFGAFCFGCGAAIAASGEDPLDYTAL